MQVRHNDLLINKCRLLCGLVDDCIWLNDCTKRFIKSEKVRSCYSSMVFFQWQNLVIFNGKGRRNIRYKNTKHTVFKNTVQCGIGTNFWARLWKAISTEDPKRKAHPLTTKIPSMPTTPPSSFSPRTISSTEPPSSANLSPNSVSKSTSDQERQMPNQKQKQCIFQVSPI